MLKALYYCHKVVKVIHRDIKPDNIMLNHNDVAVLIDFGVSAIIEGKDDSLTGSNFNGLRSSAKTFASSRSSILFLNLL